MKEPNDFSDDPKDVELANCDDWDKLPKNARDAILSAYLGIAVLETMCRVSKLEWGRMRSRDLLTEMAREFPVLPGLSAIRR